MPPGFCPNNRHIHWFVGYMVIAYRREAGSSQNFNSRVNMQIIMLATYWKILDACYNWVRFGRYVYHVVNSITAGVAYPLAACYKLPLGIISKRIAHAAVMAGKANACAYSAANTYALT